MSKSCRAGLDLNRVRTGRDCLIGACMLSPPASLTSYEVEIPDVADRKTPPKSSNDRGERQTSSRRTFNESIDYGEGKRGGFELSPTRPSPAQKPDRGQGKTKGRTMTVDDERHGLPYHLQRWVHYNRARERFFEALVDHVLGALPSGRHICRRCASGEISGLGFACRRHNCRVHASARTGAAPRCEVARLIWIDVKRRGSWFRLDDFTATRGSGNSATHMSFVQRATIDIFLSPPVLRRRCGIGCQAVSRRLTRPAICTSPAHRPAPPSDAERRAANSPRSRNPAAATARSRPYWSRPRN